jgi:hypothetical protein
MSRLLAGLVYIIAYSLLLAIIRADRKCRRNCRQEVEL